MFESVKRWLVLVLMGGLALLPFGIGDFGGVNGGPLSLKASLFWLVGVLLFFWAFRWLARAMGVQQVGISLHAGWRRNLLIGIGYGLVCILVGILMKVGLGQYQLSALPWPQVVAAALSVAVATLFIALSEELPFRGYLVRILDGQPKALVAVVSAFCFVLLHLPHWNSPIQYWVSLFLKGLFYVIPVLATRSLWFGVGHHWAWNFGYFLVFGGVAGVKATELIGYNATADLVWLIVSGLMAISAPFVARFLTRNDR